MRLIIAGGGTGGHIYSGIAVAEEWKKRKGEVLFVGTPRGMEKDLIPRYGFNLELIPVSPLKGGSVLQKLKAVLGLPRALWHSFRILRRFKPTMVFGIGGYASGPVVMMGRLLGLKTAVIDQNSVPGMTNRTLGKWVDRVFLTFPESADYFPAEKVKVFGNPVIATRIPSIQRSGSTGKTILVFGGSQGAHALNVSFIEAAPLLKEKFPDLKIVHQTGTADFEWAREELKKKGLEATVAPFFPDMEEIYSHTDLVISRAGAGTLTELALWGLPAILVPYPFAADDHQRKNADSFVQAEAALFLDQKDLTGSRLAELATSLLIQPSRLQSMAQKMVGLARPEAGKNIVDEMLVLTKAA